MCSCWAHVLNPARYMLWIFVIYQDLVPPTYLRKSGGRTGNMTSECVHYFIVEIKYMFQCNLSYANRLLHRF